jgi:hypothetical protein
MLAFKGDPLSLRHLPKVDPTLTIPASFSVVSHAYRKPPRVLRPYGIFSGFYDSLSSYLQGRLSVGRVYLSWSIDQLEAEFERAQDGGDKAAIDKIAQELNFRTTPKARALREVVDSFLGKDRKPNNKEKRDQGRSETSQPERSSPKAPTSRRRGSRLKPTEEQQQAIECFRKGGSLKINAYAGTGKTSTLELLSHSTPKSGQYIAFNRDIVRDAKEKFPSSVNCSTTHGLAFKAAPSAYKK